eukprot:3890526-Karenia_brevis.AAC.1
MDSTNPTGAGSNLRACTSKPCNSLSAFLSFSPSLLPAILPPEPLCPEEASDAGAVVVRVKRGSTNG